jgi:sterol desaturase/sphingolipid hydroxylase (fatty acid hydroxylase superfamily)
VLREFRRHTLLTSKPSSFEAGMWPDACFATGWLIIVVGHTVSSLMLRWLFYSSDKRLHNWLIQPSLLKGGWWFPALSLVGFRRKDERHPKHGLFATINLLVAASFMGASLQHVCSGEHKEQTFSSITTSVMAASAWQLFAEYYWHRMNHSSYFYKRFHKYHHYYKAPR